MLAPVVVATLFAGPAGAAPAPEAGSRVEVPDGHGVASGAVGLGRDAPPGDGLEAMGRDAPGGAVVVRPVGGELVDGYDPPESPWGPGHRGVDLAAEPGDQVRSVLAGTVTFSGMVAGRGWVTVDHGGGLDTTYGALDPRSVAVGVRVAAGDVLGLLAANATHLDWGARLGGEYTDPLGLLGQWEVHLLQPDRLVEPVAPSVSGPAPGGIRTDGPLTWPTAGRISSGFGIRVNPVTGKTRLHAGVDIGAPTGTPIVAATAGVVSSSGRAGGYGNLVIVEHPGGMQTRYAHASALLVRAGERVQRGQLLALVGSTGNSTGPHLHFEIRIGGEPRDPLPFYGR